VVRVAVPETRGASYGSGALVAVSQSHGLVLTNWHVVRSAAGQITVVFPDGFCSGASVLKTDRDWDLAALAIWRPVAEPIALAAEAPQPGEVLTIAGYGRGWYREAAGRCTQYVSPGGRFPFEMVELATPARDGDSGGPILNSRGELAGVLFGSAFGRTTGSYCGRVRWFVAPAIEQLYRLPSGPTIIARRPEVEPAPVAALGGGPSPAESEVSEDSSDWRPGRIAVQPLPEASEIGAAPVGLPANPPPPVLPNRTEQAKTILAAIGLMAIFFHGLRMLGAAAGR